MMKMIDKIIEKASKVATKEVFNILNKRKKERKKRKKEPSILEQLMKNPEGFKLEAWVKGNEIIFKLIKNENEEDLE